MSKHPQPTPIVTEISKCKSALILIIECAKDDRMHNRLKLLCEQQKCLKEY